MEYDLKELKEAIKTLNKAKITKNRIKLSGGNLLEKFLDEIGLIIDSGLSSNIPDEVVSFYESLEDSQDDVEINEETEIEEETVEEEVVDEIEEEETVIEEETVDEKNEDELDLDDPEIWHVDEPLPEKEEEVLIKQAKRSTEINFNQKGKPISNTMSVFANVMDIYLDNHEVDVPEIILILKKRGIVTTERYASVRLKHAKDMFALMEKRGMLK